MEGTWCDVAALFIHIVTYDLSFQYTVYADIDDFYGDGIVMDVAYVRYVSLFRCKCDR